MTENINTPQLEVAVGTSTKKDAREAGREVAKNTLNKMNTKPDFILLFSTASYEKQGGFNEFLNGVWEVLPDKTQLIGGTVAGFINHEGCYAKGATALAVSYPNMHITLGYGKNTKRNPKKAARQCAEMIKNKIKNRYKNKILLSVIAGPEMPSKTSPFIDSKIVARLMLSLLSLSQEVFQIGFGREETVLEELTRLLPDFNLIHTSAIETQGSTNYQFLNNKVLKEHVVVLGIETDLDFSLNSAHGAEKIDVDFKITKISKDKTLIKKINNKPAFLELLQLMNWSKQKLEEERWISITNKYPLGFYKNNKIFLRPVMMVMGDFMGCMGKIENENMFVTQISPTKMVQSVDEIIKCNTPEFGFFVSCMARQSYLGSYVYNVQEKLKQYFQDKPFLLIYSGSEAIYQPTGKLEYFNETATSAIFSRGEL